MLFPLDLAVFFNIFSLLLTLYLLVFIYTMFFLLRYPKYIERIYVAYANIVLSTANTLEDSIEFSYRKTLYTYKAFLVTYIVLSIVASVQVFFSSTIIIPHYLIPLYSFTIFCMGNYLAEVFRIKTVAYLNYLASTNPAVYEKMDIVKSLSSFIVEIENSRYDFYKMR